MILTDYLVYAALAAVIVLWWQRSSYRATAAGFLLVLAGLSIALNRWQGGVAGVVAVCGLLGLGIGRLLNRSSDKLPWIAASSMTMLGAFAAWTIWLFPVTDLPEPGGPHPVGVRDFVLTDTSRPGLLAAREDEPRKLLVRVWYPAAETADIDPRPYFSDEEVATTARGFGGVVGLPFLFTYIGHAQTNSYPNAPLIEDARQLPVAIYSHGYTSFAGQNTVLMEELASHGYLAFAVHHSHDSATAVLPDGSTIPTDPRLIEEMFGEEEQVLTEDMVNGFTSPDYQVRRDSLLNERRKNLDKGQRITAVSAQIWLDDRLFVHDELAAGEVDSSVLDIVQAGDFSRTGQIGMSFGGSTTGAVCLVDRRCAAGVNLDGGDYHGSPFNAQQSRPFMMFYSDFDLIAEQMGADPEQARGFNDFSYERHELAGLSRDIVRVKTENVAHLGVSDFNLFFRNPVREAFLGSIDGHTMVQIQNDFVLGFFDTHVHQLDAGFPNRQLQLHSGDVSAIDASPVRAWWTDEHDKDRTVQVVIETSLGDVEVALYPNRAPVSVENFLAYVDSGHYERGSFYRAVYKQTDPSTIGVIQGGLLQASMTGDGSEYAEPDRVLPPIEHETTHMTGISNERGTLAYARLAPGTAGSEIFFNMSDNEVLDTDNGGPNRDGHGYATFGRVVRGMKVLEDIQAQPKGGATGIEALKGQILSQPVSIRRMYRREEK